MKFRDIYVRIKEGLKYSDLPKLDFMTDYVIRVNEQDRIMNVYSSGFNFELTRQEKAGEIKGRVIGEIKLGNEVKAIDIKSRPYKLTDKQNLEGKIIKIEEVN